VVLRLKTCWLFVDDTPGIFEPHKARKFIEGFLMCADVNFCGFGVTLCHDFNIFAKDTHQF